MSQTDPDRTRWSKLLLQGTAAEEAWTYFYERYHPAVSRLFLRLGLPPGQSRSDVEDLVHGFFQTAFERELLDRADPERGRFRGYLKVAAQRYLDSCKRSAGRQKRRPADGVAALDAMTAEPAGGSLTPEEEFDLAWGRGVLARAGERLVAELVRRGRETDATVFRLRTQDGVAWDAISAQTGVPEPTLRRRHREARELFARFLREEVGETVTGERELELELAELQSIFARAASGRSLASE